MPPKGEIKKKSLQFASPFQSHIEDDVKFRIGFLRKISLENVYVPQGSFGFSSPHWKDVLSFDISMLFTVCI